MSLYETKEFAIALPNTQLEIAAALANIIRKQVKRLAISQNPSRVVKLSERIVTISLGAVRAYPSPEITPTILIMAAKNALAESKKQEYDCVSYRAIDISQSTFDNWYYY